MTEDSTIASILASSSGTAWYQAWIETIFFRIPAISTPLTSVLLWICKDADHSNSSRIVPNSGEVAAILAPLGIHSITSLAAIPQASAAYERSSLHNAKNSSKNIFPFGESPLATFTIPDHGFITTASSCITGIIYLEPTATMMISVLR